jgi:hypothetical protein
MCDLFFLKSHDFMLISTRYPVRRCWQGTRWAATKIWITTCTTDPTEDDVFDVKVNVGCLETCKT